MKKQRILRMLNRAVCVLLISLCVSAAANAVVSTDPAYLRRIADIQSRTLTEMSIEQQALLDALPERFRPLTYDLLGGDAVAYLRLTQGYLAEELEYYYNMKEDVLRGQLLGMLNELQYPEDDREVQLALRLYCIAAKRYCDLEQADGMWTLRSYEQAQGYETPISDLSLGELRAEIAKNTADASYRVVQEAWLAYRTADDRLARTAEIAALPYAKPTAGQQEIISRGAWIYSALSYELATHFSGFAYLRESGYTPEELAPWYGLGSDGERLIAEQLARGGNNDKTRDMLRELHYLYRGRYDGIPEGVNFDTVTAERLRSLAVGASGDTKTVLEYWVKYLEGDKPVDDLAAEIRTLALRPLDERQLAFLSAAPDIFRPNLFGMMQIGYFDPDHPHVSDDYRDEVTDFGYAYLHRSMGYDAQELARWHFRGYSEQIKALNAAGSAGDAELEKLLTAITAMRSGYHDYAFFEHARTVTVWVKDTSESAVNRAKKLGISLDRLGRTQTFSGKKRLPRALNSMTLTEVDGYLTQAEAEGNIDNWASFYGYSAEQLQLLRAYRAFLAARSDTDALRKLENDAVANIPAPVIGGSHEPKLFTTAAASRQKGRVGQFLRSVPQAYQYVAYRLTESDPKPYDAFFRESLSKTALAAFHELNARSDGERIAEYMRLYAKREGQDGVLNVEDADRLELLRCLMIARRYSNYGQVVAVRCDSIRNLLMLQYKQESVTKLESDQLKAYADALAPAADDVYGQEYAAFVRALQAFRASDPRAAADSGSFLNLPETMSDTVLDVVKNTNEYQRVYAYLAADRGLMQKYGENEWSYRFWTWTPQQLEVWVGAYNQLREEYHRLGMWNEVGGEALDADYEKVSDILTLYGDAPYFDAENPSFFRDYDGPVAFRNHVFRYGTREDYQTIYEAWDESRGWKTCLEAGVVYCQAFLNPNGGGTNGVPHFVSSRGMYHFPLAHRNVEELYEYRAEMERKYRSADDPGDEAELKQWLALIDAWIALRQERVRESGGWEVFDDRTAGETRANTYLLEIGTGAAAGANIEYLQVKYTADGVQKTAYVLPQEGWAASSYADAAKLGTGRTAARWVQDNLGYRASDGTDVQSLGSYRTDQFLLSLYGTVESIDEIQAFARQDRTSLSGNNWTLYGISLYRVDGVRGVERCGYYSSDVYIDFDGALAARVTFDGDTVSPGQGAGGVALGKYHDLNWTGSDTLFRFGGTLSTFGYGLQTTGLDGGARTGSAADANVILKIDFADRYQAGLECLATNYTGDRTLSGGGNVCEAMALQVRYIDVSGGTRQATLPVVTSAAAWLINSRIVDVKEPFAGLAQQGESIAFPCSLPDFSEMVSITVINGASAAAEAARLTAVKDFYAAEERDRRIELSNADRVSITGIAVYQAPESALSADTKDGFARFTVDASPTQYYVSATEEGTGINAGTRVTMLSEAFADRSRGAEQAGQYLRSYAPGSRLKPRGSEEQYLVSIYTDDVEHAGTVDDVVLRLKYTDLDGVEQETPAFNARDYAGEYYGFWPASESDFGYRYGLSVTPQENGAFRGGELRFLVPVRNVRTFTGATLRLGGADARGRVGDEWQMKDLAIQTVESVGPRVLAWQAVSCSGGVSDRVFTRTLEGREIFRLSTMGAAGGENSETGSNHGSSGSVLFQGADSHTWDIDAPSEVERISVDWNRLKYNMSYADALQNLGFRQTRGIYTVDVNVAGNAGNYGEDDCGSKNQFYFQLLFEDGASGVVLANQQLESDGFHAGATERFQITTTKDFGELQAIRVIPEDISSDSDKYDKLKIDSILVRRAGSGQTSPLWKFADVGWIGIDYRDEGAAESMGGAESRTMEEIASTYPVTESTVSVNLQFNVTTAPYVSADGSAQPQFSGEMSAIIRYRDTNGAVRRVQIPDVVRLMYDFNNQTPVYTEIANRTEGTTVTGNAVSNPDYMFRANHTDRFTVGLDGLDRLLSIQFRPTANEQTKWNVSDVSAYLIHGEGRRLLNAQGEYIMSYRQGEELEPIAWDTSTATPRHSADMITTGSRTTGFEVEFGSTKLTLDADAARTLQLGELPMSENDTLNVVLFPDEAGSDWAFELYNLKLAAQYSVAGRDALMQASVKEMNHAVMPDGTKAFAWEGLNVSGINALYSLNVKADRDGQCAVTGGYAQLVRGGFVYQTYALGRAGLLGMGNEIAFVPLTGERQELRLQLSADMAEQRLVTGKNDVAVSIRYRTDGPVDREYQSPRILLSKQDISVLRPGQILDLTFAQGRVREITGVTIQTVGSAAVSVDCAYASDIVTNAGSETVNGRWSFLPGAGERGSLIGMYRAEDADGRGRVDALTLTFDTAAGQENKGGGLNAPLAVTVGYYDGYGTLRTHTVSDLRPYLQDRSGFPANSTATARLLVSDVADLRYIELTPGQETGGTTVWNLTRITARFGDDGQELERTVMPPLEANVTYHYNLANILVSAAVERTVAVTGADGKLTTATQTEETKDGALSVLLASGESLRVVPKIVGSTEGVNVTLYGLNTANGALGSAKLADTRGYTAAYIAERVECAPSEEEAAVWRGVKPADGSFTAGADGSYTFTPPRNYTGSPISYRIMLTSAESGDVSAYVDVTVNNEAYDPVAKRIEEVRAEVQAALRRTQTSVGNP